MGPCQNSMGARVGTHTIARWSIAKEKLTTRAHGGASLGSSLGLGSRRVFMMRYIGWASTHDGNSDLGLIVGRWGPKRSQMVARVGQGSRKNWGSTSQLFVSFRRLLVMKASSTEGRGHRRRLLHSGGGKIPRLPFAT